MVQAGDGDFLVGQRSEQTQTLNLRRSVTAARLTASKTTRVGILGSLPMHHPYVLARRLVDGATILSERLAAAERTQLWLVQMPPETLVNLPLMAVPRAVA